MFLEQEEQRIAWEEKEQEYFIKFPSFSAKVDVEILRINAIQVPIKLRTLKIGTSSQHVRNKDTMERQLDTFLANNLE